MIESSYLWTNIFLLAIGTLLIRSSVIAFAGHIKISPRTKEIFSFIPSAILPAIAAPMVFYHQGQVEWLLYKERLVVLVLTAVVAYIFKRMTVTLLFGLLLLYILTAF